MIRSMYSAISGLKQHQTMLDVTANNLANVNTVGYKGARTAFKDQLAQTLSGGSGSSATTAGQNAAQVGLGVQLGGIDNVITNGSLQTTGAPLDVAIQGEGWFRVGLSTAPAVPAAADLTYTRAGNFSRNDDGYLVTADGYFVIGRTAGVDALINIPDGATGVSVSGDGTVSYIPAAGGARVSAGTLSLAKFSNENGLARVSGNRWDMTPAAGTEIVGAPGGTYGATIGGTLEMSNVDLAAEFTSMIVSQRGFQANSRVISTTDEMLQDLVNLKR